MLEFAPAKVNLALHVTRRRPDFYHELESLVVFADLGDELDASPGAADSLTVAGPFADAIGTGPINLVLRAVAAFRAQWPDLVAGGLALTLTKNLPVAAGLGGGSADAAAALRLMVRRAAAPVPAVELLALAARLGADVPVCLVSRPCQIAGIGDIVRPLADFPPCHLVLVNPLVPVATADVFRRLARHDNPGLPPLPEPLTRPAQLGIWLEETRNDLQAPAMDVLESIGDLIARIGAAPGCILARMSGSGATVFGLFGSSAQAHQAAHDLRRALPNAWVAAAPVIQP